jgi:ABC-type dipeptide/oligopeptide/nickel transport system ATPase subunit
VTLTAEGISISVAGYGRVVDGVSARFTSSEVVGVTGPSGAGKSTLGRGLCGLQRLERGRVWMEDGGTEPGRDTRRRIPGAAAVQLAFQDALSSFPPHLRVSVPLLDAVRAGGRRGRSEARAYLAALLAELGIAAELTERRPAEVSGGQLQRLALARALALRPGFLVLDEITSALDPATERRVLDVVGRYRRRHELGIIIISHDVGLLRRNVDRIIVMDRGRIAETGEPRTLFSNPGHPTTMALARALRHISGGIA